MTAPRGAATPDRSLRRQTIIGSVVLLAGAVVAFGLTGTFRHRRSMPPSSR